jgi:uncharacterized membrane protein
MLGRSKTDAVKKNVLSGKDLALELVQDKKFRKQMMSALGHGAVSNQRARRRIGTVAMLRRLATDEQLRQELSEMVSDLQAAWARLERKRSNRLRKSLLVVATSGAAGAAAMPATRQWVADWVSGAGVDGHSAPTTIEETIEVAVPVSTAYNQWTQFEEFPQFMEGVELVEQLDDSRLHWVATVGGKRAEWDAKILEQHPDHQISWVSEDGKKNRGTVTFEDLGTSGTLIRLSMGYQREGMREALGSAVGADKRRVRGDLERFKRLVENRGEATGAWRGDISGGETT